MIAMTTNAIDSAACQFMSPICVPEFVNKVWFNKPALSSIGQANQFSVASKRGSTTSTTRAVLSSLEKCGLAVDNCGRPQRPALQRERGGHGRARAVAL
jgi:hypothetical protein